MNYMNFNSFFGYYDFGFINNEKNKEKYKNYN